MSNGATAGWTDERVETLRKLWLGGLSGAEIAKQLGITRSAVLGKVARLGLLGLEGVRQTAPRRRAVSRPKARPAPALPPPLPVPPSTLAASLSVITPTPAAILALERRSCRWPTGDAFCGRQQAPRADGHGYHPYCSAHAALAFLPPKARRSAKELERGLRNL